MAKSPALSSGRMTGDVASVPDRSDPVMPILLEFESPTAALVNQRAPAGARYTTWSIALMCAAFVVVANTVPIDRVVSTTGKVVATAANVVVQPLETSIVRSIDVREGQLVKTGDLLARLDPTFAAADAGSLETQVASLQAEVNRLQAEVSDQPYIPDGTAPSQLQSMMFVQRHAERAFRLENYRQKIDSSRAKVAQAVGDIESYGQRLIGARSVEAKRMELQKLEVGSQLNTLAARDARLELERNLQTSQTTADSYRRDLDAIAAERDSYAQQIRTESSQTLTEQGRKLAEAKENLNKARLRRNLVELRADRDSIVLSVAPVSVGSVMQSGDQFVTLVPVDSPLEVETIVDGRDAGFVSVGDTTTIKFDTFPYYTHGTAEGVVRAVSPDSFRNPNADRQGKLGRPQASEDFGTLYYRTKISLDTIKLHNLPPGFRMAPGMPVTADIKIGERTVMRYLLQRMIPATTEGMREP
jgi:HlyD family secretion protein